MPITATDSEKASAASRLHIAIVGREKAGKSRLAATGRKNILFLDADRRIESVAGTPGVFGLSFRDKAWPEQPTAVSEMLDVVTRLEASLDLAKLAMFDMPAEPAKLIGTVVLDSVTTLAKCAMRFCLYNNKELRRSVNIASKLEVHFPRSYDGWAAEMELVESIILRLMGLPCDFITTFHESSEEAPDSTDENPKFTGRVTTYPVRYSRLLKYFSEVWRLERTGNIPTVQLVPDYRFTTATALLVDKVDRPDILDLIKKHESASAAARK